MRDSVSPGLRALTQNHEGFMRHMYLDNRGLVTTALGRLIDTSDPDKNVMGGTITADAMRFPWKVNGRPATPEEIRSSWLAVKNSQHRKEQGGGFHSNIPGNIVRLDDDAVEDIYRETVASFEKIIRGYFPSYDAWPADAQLVALSIAYGVGPHFARTYKKFRAAANDGPTPDFERMAEESGMKNNPGRTRDHQIAMMNAAAVARGGGDPDTLYFPESVGEFIRANPGKSAGVGVLGIAMFAGATYAGIKYGKAKGWVK